MTYKNFLEEIKPGWVLRIGLGIMYLYSGYGLFFHPKVWAWAVPQWFAKIVSAVISIDTYIRFQGVAEFLMGLVFLAWFLPRRVALAAAILAAAEMASILLFSGINSITFRDIGLLGAALALILWKSDFNK